MSRFERITLDIKLTLNSLSNTGDGFDDGGDDDNDCDGDDDDGDCHDTELNISSSCLQR